MLAAAGVTEQTNTESPQSSPKNNKVLLIRCTPTRLDDSAAGALRAPWEDRGIVQVLSDASKWPRCIQKVPGVPLYVMLRGATNRQHALSPINFEKVPELLDTLREHFEWIMLDGVSYASSPDAAWISEACDGTLFVVGQNAPCFGGLNDSLSQIPPDRMVGLVMNQGITPHKRGFRVCIRLGRRA